MGHPKPAEQKPLPNMAPLPRYAAPMGELLASIGLPESTYALEESKGRGCKTFKIGRRKFAMLTDWADWLQSRADGVSV